jgi:hypothetical protein
MPIIVGPDGVRGDLFDYLARLERLSSDLEVIGQGGGPSQAQLASAPVLDGYRLAVRPTACLVGVCQDHPLIDGPFIYTSDLCAYAPELGWARTLSRYYRLGEADRNGERR